jgi:RNA polymerase sigma-70 factor, ECF subfamily
MAPVPEEMEHWEAPSMDDDELLRLFGQTGQNTYFAEIFERHWVAVLGRCRSILRDAAAAEELTQDTFVQAFNHAHTFHGGSVKAWLITIASHLCFNRLRRGRLERDALTLITRRSGGIHARHDDAILVEVAAVLNLLNDRQRQALKMFYFDGFSYEEIAQTPGWDAGTVRSLIQNGRIQFAKLWKQRRGDMAL